MSEKKDLETRPKRSSDISLNSSNEDLDFLPQKAKKIATTDNEVMDRGGRRRRRRGGRRRSRSRSRRRRSRR